MKGACPEGKGIQMAVTKIERAIEFMRKLSKTNNSAALVDSLATMRAPACEGEARATYTLEQGEQRVIEISGPLIVSTRFYPPPAFPPPIIIGSPGMVLVFPDTVQFANASYWKELTPILTTIYDAAQLFMNEIHDGLIPPAETGAFGGPGPVVEMIMTALPCTCYFIQYVDGVGNKYMMPHSLIQSNRTPLKTPYPTGSPPCDCG